MQCTNKYTKLSIGKRNEDNLNILNTFEHAYNGFENLPLHDRDNQVKSPLWITYKYKNHSTPHIVARNIYFTIIFV